MRAAILAAKERGRSRLALDLGHALANSIAMIGPLAPSALVPVPSRWRARRSRGMDTTAVIATHAAAVLRRRGVSVRVLSALSIARGVADQAGLSVDERWVNVAGAYAVRPRALTALRHAAITDRIVVVDDVLTTGATLAEACRALAAAGVVPMAAAVVAATPRR